MDSWLILMLMAGFSVIHLIELNNADWFAKKARRLLRNSPEIKSGFSVLSASTYAAKVTSNSHERKMQLTPEHENNCKA